MEDFFTNLLESVRTLLEIPEESWRLFINSFLYPRDFYNNISISSYKSYLTSAVLLITAVLAPTIPIESRSPNTRIPLVKAFFQIVLKKVSGIIIRFAFKSMIFYMGVLYGVILYFLFWPFVDSINWGIHLKGLVIVFSTLCILYSLILLLDRIIYKLFSTQSILLSYKNTFQLIDAEKKKTPRKKEATSTHLSEKLARYLPQIVLQRIHFQEEITEKMKDNMSPFQQRLILAFLLYAVIYTFTAMCWLHL